MEMLKQAVIDGDGELAVGETKSLLKSGDAIAIVQQALVPAMDAVAELWKEGEYFMSDVILSANAFSDAMAILSPALSASGVANKGKFALGVVAGDLHDLGKNIVVAMLKANNYEVVDMGVDVSIATFVETVKKEKPDILGIGAYMSTTMSQIGDIIDALAQEGLRATVKIIIGGVCVTQDTVRKYNADAYGGDALETVRQANLLMEEAVR
jgi:5-methyltetrahydrofolate--homocysteine methyltransferase